MIGKCYEELKIPHPRTKYAYISTTVYNISKHHLHVCVCLVHEKLSDLLVPECEGHDAGSLCQPPGLGAALLVFQQRVVVLVRDVRQVYRVLKNIWTNVKNISTAIELL